MTTRPRSRSEDQKQSAKQLLFYNGSRDQYQTWSDRMLNHIRKKNKEAYKVLVGKTPKPEPTEEDPMARDVEDYMELCEDIWMIFGEHIDDSTYQHLKVHRCW